MIERHSWSVLATLLVLGSLSSCSDNDAPPRPQWLVEVSTDAPVPQIGDRLLVEVLSENGQLACPTCRREEVLADLHAWPATFGIEATSADVFVRARLYRSDHVGTEGQPDPSMTIDKVGRLPPLADGITAVGIRLELACIGSPAADDASATCDGGEAGRDPMVLGGPLGSNGALSSLLDDVQTDCTKLDSIEPGMSCVPGGLFFLGDSLAPVPHSDVAATATPERLFAVDTFQLDQHEVTVAEFDTFVQKSLALGTIVLTDGCPSDADPTKPKLMFCRKPSEAATSQKLYCTYNVGDAVTGDPPAVEPATDDRAVNCVSRAVAQAYCASVGKRLPSEVEWEFAAANGTRETRFPWDNRPPSCDLAWLSRGALSPIDQPYVQCASTDGGDTTTDLSGATSLSGMPLLPDGLPADRAQPWAGGPSDKSLIFGLAGNLSEWTADYFAAYGATDDPSCWVPNGPISYLRDRIADGAWCEPPASSTAKYKEYSIRGGSWRESLNSAWSASRAHATDPSIVPRPDVGFRCAR